MKSINIKKKEMEKIYLKNGKEVQLGDILTKVSKVENPPFSESTVVQRVVVTEGILPELIKAGIVTIAKPEKPVTKAEIPMEMEYYIQKIAEKLGWKVDKVYNYLNSVDTILPAAAFSMVLREIAIELDKKYKAHIKNYRNFAAFRSVDDAKIACRITKDILKEMFKSKSGK